MSHQFENGFFVQKPAWHGLGVLLADAPPTAAAAIVSAGLGWSVFKTPLEAIVQDNNTWHALSVPRHFAVVRKITQADTTPTYQTLGVVGDQYRPVQNEAAFEFFNRIVETGMVEYHTAGSLRGGRTVFVLARLNGNLRIAGDDVVDKYLLLSNSHDGSSPVRIMFTPIRVVCSNTLAMATARADKHKRISIRHTAGAVARIQNVAEYLAGVNAQFEQSADLYRYLAQRSINTFQLSEYLTRLFPDPAETAKRNSARSIRDRITALFENGRGTDITATNFWRALNAVSEFVDHSRNLNNPDSRMYSAWFGQGMQVKETALQLAMQLAAA
ncbi:MAG: hypothetical protein CVU65_00210 [Deltaproteobacteria bacterium HGW-Deltaproteobacteria-22]|jgi:phage/plasmid-like protein (TIGR03299 family)|nr:MAG: hypothetical protein CVU65_00210 [Deltaproteobacteria bacterium HGW-Deltaproteobacteria-22]